MKKRALIFSALFLGLTTLSTHAQTVVIASFEFTGTSAAEVSPTTEYAGVSASDFSSPVFTFSTNTNNLQTADGLGLADGSGNDMAGAVTTQQYFTFTITADSGYAFDLDNLTFDIGRGLRGAEDYAVRSSVDSYVDNIVFADDAIDQTPAGQDINLYDSAYNGLTSIGFRIYLDDRRNNSASASETFIDNVVLNGTVSAIPEPSAYAAILGCLALAILIVRRKGAAPFNLLSFTAPPHLVPTMNFPNRFGKLFIPTPVPGIRFTRGTRATGAMFVVVLGLLTASVQAQVVISNPSNTVTGGSSVSATQWKAMLFTTGSLPTQLSSITLGLNPKGFTPTELAPVTQNVSISIYSVFDATPFTLLATTGITAVTMSATGGVYTFDSLPDLTFSASTA